ncbi:hypothetical protein TI39_contig602g00001 [Zymoseptoria brevis]|uniref:Uncharacterized protein n=1 Tax=Zymoseptoria brevis TaxID=1047168 RepID=A0A0F4GH07_9PEZI|nr:hypothetical protein TI39_contig602g00001 [Zymoseptoria brevis]
MSVPPRVPPGNHDWAADFQYWLDITMEQLSNIINGHTDRNNVHHAFPPAGFSRYIPRGQQGICERQLMRALNDFWPNATEDEKE